MTTSNVSPRVANAYHDEVVVALRRIGDRRLGAAVAKDRGSSMEALGIRFPL